MLDVFDLDFEYYEESLLRNVSFHLVAGGLLHLRGANGVGKTTLLKLLAGLYQPVNGEIYYFGKPIHSKLADYQKKLCFVGHKSGVNPFLTIRENCFLDIHYGSKVEKLTQLAAVFKLEKHLDKLCALLSAGQRRQVGLLRLWMSDANLWLLDEPLVALDDSACSVLMEHLSQHRKKGGGVILTSHQPLPLNGLDYQEYFL